MTNTETKVCTCKCSQLECRDCEMTQDEHDEYDTAYVAVNGTWEWAR